MTPSVVRPRGARAWVSPSTHLKASTMLLFPEPLGPTIATMPPSKRISVRRAKVLKPLSVMARRCTAWPRRLPDMVGGGHLVRHRWAAHAADLAEPARASAIALDSIRIWRR